MGNRFLDIDVNPTQRRRNHPGTGLAGAFSGEWARALSAADRRLVILIENGGVDLGIPELVGHLLSAIPGADDLIPEALRQRMIAFLREKIRALTDNLLENVELSINRYSASKPNFYGDVIVLRDGTASYHELKNTLLALSREQKLIDLLILTHGSNDFISVNGGIDTDRIRDMRQELGRPLQIRSVYMMNCVGSSLNQAWIDAGAKVSYGTLRNNYLPEPTTYFFWRNWTEEGQPFETAVTSAYRKTINLMNEAVRGFVSALPIPGASSLAAMIDLENLDFVKDSAPVVQGQRSLTIASDSLSFANTLSSHLATTVLPVHVLEELGSTGPGSGSTLGAGPSAAGLEFLKRWEPPRANGVTLEAATQTLIERASEAARILQESVKVPLQPNQIDALVSFVCNVGGKAFGKSTLLRRLNQGDFAGAVGELKKWTKVRREDGIVDAPALVERRLAEADLFQPSGSLYSAKSIARHSYVFSGRSPIVSQQSGHYSLAQTPVVAGIAIADAVQIGLGAVAVVQTQASASQGSFLLTFDKAQRMLTTEARSQMPGAQVAKQSYSAHLFAIGIPGRGEFANADVIIVWEGNPYGEIGTPVIRRNLSNSSEWSKSSANIAINKVDRIPLPNTDPRAWPIVYSYDGTYDAFGNGYWEFSGDFEINAFGGLLFTRHEVVSRSLLEFAISKEPTEYVRKGKDIVVPVPAVPAEQMAYLKTKLP